MKYRTMEERVELGWLIINNLDTFPIKVRDLSVKLGMRRSKYMHILTNLHNAKLVSYCMINSKIRGWRWATDTMPSKQFVQQELVKLENRGWKPEEDDEQEFISDPITKRRCRICKKFLPQSRYFSCAECQDLSLENDDFIFHGPMVEDTQEIDIEGDFFEEDIARLAASMKNEEQNE